MIKFVLIILTGNLYKECVGPLGLHLKKIYYCAHEVLGGPQIHCYNTALCKILEQRWYKSMFGK